MQKRSTHRMLPAACLLLALGVSSPAAPPSPAETAIRKAEAALAKSPDHVPYHNALAMAYARRARETSDVRYYEEAEEALRKSFTLSPDNFEGRKVQAWLLLGRHEFAGALALASDLNRRVPDDVTVYGLLADANAESGNYRDAVAATQWMLDLRPGNVAGLTRAAYLRELHGDLGGALDLMQMAFDATPLQEAEDRAWLLTQVSHLRLLAGDLAGAERQAAAALTVFPDYHYALNALAQVRLEQKRYPDAVRLLEQRFAAAPHAENLFSLGEALGLAGRNEEASAALAEFERQALAESSQADNANHELVLYYADHASAPAKAVALAKRELGRRHDVFTQDCYAWALAAAGDYASAGAVLRELEAMGVRDPRVLRHARQVSEHMGRSAMDAGRRQVPGDSRGNAMDTVSP